MKRNTFNLLMVLGLILALGGGIVMARRAQAQGPGPEGPSSIQAAVGTAFTYQGRLEDTSGPVNGTCNFGLSLYGSSGGADQIGTTQDKMNVSVSNGYFTVTDLDFGASAFDGNARYLEIAVDCGSGPATLSPRVALNAAPYAHSLRPGAKVESTGTALQLTTSATSGDALNVIASAVSGNAAAVYGGSSSSGGAGLSGYNSSSGYGVYGSSTSGYGVYGKSGIASGKPALFGVGVWGDGDSSVGVYGTSNSSGGVVGFSTSNSGVAGISTSGNAVEGTSISGVGVYGTASTTGTVGIATASSGTNYGVYGKTNSSSGYGVYGISPSTNPIYAGVIGANTGGGNGSGVYGYSLGGRGVYGLATVGTGVYGTGSTTGTVGIATGSGTTYGVYGKADSLSGKGVYGEGGYFGVHGYGTDPTGTSYGVYGQTESTSAGSYGGYFRNDNNVGLYAEGYDGGSRSMGDIRLAGGWGVIGADDNSDSSMSLLSNDDVVVYLDNNDDDATSCFSIYDPGDSAIVPIWEVCHTGTAASGTKSAIVDTQDYGTRKLYAMESPDVWFEDFGAGTLVSGVATVGIEPIFAETVNLDEYHVFLTPLGDCNGLYVAAKTPTSFEVRELGGGTANISFDYRIVAHRLGYEDVRLEEVQK